MFVIKTGFGTLSYKKLTHWLLVMHMTPQNWVDIGSGNGMVLSGTRPLPEPMLNYLGHFILH